MKNIKFPDLIRYRLASTSRLPVAVSKFMYFDWLILALLGGIVLYCAWLYRHFAQDDAFITFRYARNIAAGHGFVYNLNEPTFGTTTPLYTLTLALLGKLLAMDIRILGYLVTVFCLWLSGMTLYELGKSNGSLFAGVVAFILVTNPLLVSSIQMETFFLLALLLIALKFYLREKYVVAGIILGLLALTRYEMILFAAILGMHFLITHKQLPFWLGPTIFIVAAWLCFSWYTFGMMVPQSAAAKVATLNTGDGYRFATGLAAWWLVYAGQAKWFYLLLPLVFLGSYALIWTGKIETAYLILLAWTVFYFIGASFIAGSFPWYYGPLMPGLSILLTYGLDYLSQRLTGRLSHPMIRPALFTTLGLCIIGLQLISWSRGWVIHNGAIVDRRSVVYAEVSTWLADHADPDASLATGEIGVLGYYTDLYIVDLRGLVTPKLIPWLPDGREQTLKKALVLYTPTYILTDEEPLLKLLGDSEDYQIVQRFGENSYFLYQRQ